MENCEGCGHPAGGCAALGGCGGIREGRSEAEAVATSEVTSEAQCECGETETTRARCDDCGCEDFAMCDGCGKIFAVSVPPNCACGELKVSAAALPFATPEGDRTNEAQPVTVAKCKCGATLYGAAAYEECAHCGDEPGALPFTTPEEDAANEEAQAAQRSRDFAKAELVKLARRGESLAVQLAQFDADHAEEVLGFLGALTDSMEQGPGAVTPMITTRLRKLRAEVGVLTRGAQRLEAEHAKATTRATAAEFKLNAARELADMYLAGGRRAERDRDASERALEEARATESRALSRIIELEGLLREVRDYGQCGEGCPPLELLVRIGKAVRS